MKVNIICPFTNNTGGIRIILQYAQVFQKNGFDTTLYFPILKYAESWRLDPAKLARQLFSSPRLFSTKVYRALFKNADRRLPLADGLKIKAVPLILAPFVRNADVVMATAWPTAYSVAGLPERCGKKFYFVQGYENWGKYSKRAVQSYNLPLDIVTISGWLTDKITKQHGRSILAEVHNGVDLKLFRPLDAKDQQSLAILLPFSELPQKRSREGLDVLRKIKMAFPQVEVNVFGLFKDPLLGDFYNYFENLEQPALVALYQKAHILLYPSVEEGWGLPILEAMACKCAVVANRMGCVPELENGKNMLISENFDFGDLEEHIRFLIRNPEKREIIAENGFQTASSFDLEGQAKKLMAILR